jgi:hypothetical protein
MHFAVRHLCHRQQHGRWRAVIGGDGRDRCRAQLRFNGIEGAQELFDAYRLGDHRRGTRQRHAVER